MGRVGGTMITAAFSVPVKKDSREDLVDIGHYQYINGSNFCNV